MRLLFLLFFISCGSEQKLIDWADTINQREGKKLIKVCLDQQYEYDCKNYECDYFLEDCIIRHEENGN